MKHSLSGRAGFAVDAGPPFGGPSVFRRPRKADASAILLPFRFRFRFPQHPAAARQTARGGSSLPVASSQVAGAARLASFSMPGKGLTAFCRERALALWRDSCFISGAYRFMQKLPCGAALPPRGNGLAWPRAACAGSAAVCRPTGNAVRGAARAGSRCRAGGFVIPDREGVF